jgi:hypothetical protein
MSIRIREDEDNARTSMDKIVVKEQALIRS